MTAPNQPGAQHISFADAPAWLAQRAAELRAAHVSIAITGPVGAGKSSLARALSACVLSTDDYLPDYDAVPYEDRDDPARADLTRLLKNLRELAAGRPTRVPVWSFQSHRREGERAVAPAPLIICEGLHALHATLAPAQHLRVYVDAPAAVRWQRWEVLESTGQRGWGVEVARKFFDEVAEPTFARFGRLYRASAHVIVQNDG